MLRIVQIVQIVRIQDLRYHHLIITKTGIRPAYQCPALTCTGQVQGLIILEKILA
jgi:hypothetical protein